MKRRDKDMKNKLITIGTIIGVIIGVILVILIIFFVGYLFFAYVRWIFSDPFNFISGQSFEELPTYQECVKNGGVPIRSEWNGDVKRCDK